MLTAIQTAYKGYHFRSRLEARWAVYFDALGLTWDYEQEGYVLPDGRGYLPDFRLKGVRGVPNLWFEIKPSFGIPNSELTKLFAFAKCLADAQENGGVIIVRGVPPAADAFIFGTFAGVAKCGILEPELLARLLGATPAQIAEAADKARSARFEHGQKGATL